MRYKKVTVVSFLTAAILFRDSSLQAAEISVKGPSAASQITISDKAPDLKYPPIRLEVAEASLNASLLATKDELIQGSQVLEEALHRGGAVYRDAALEKYLNEALPIDLLGEKAKGFQYRIYVLKDPTVNAMTTPTGSIYINSGILAVMQNTDQIRLVLGHEVHHIIDQDIVHKYKKFKDEVGAINFLQLVGAPLVAIAIGESDADSARVIANVYTAASLTINISYQLAFLGYGRDEENQCDQFALRIFGGNRYNLENAKRVFQLFEDEHTKFGKGFRSHFFSDHETGKQRAERVEKYMKELGYQPGAEVEPDEQYDVLTKEIRIENARLNLKLRRPQHALDDLHRLQKTFASDARIPHLLGKAYVIISQDPRVLKDEVSAEFWKKLKIRDEKVQKETWAKMAEEYLLTSVSMDALYAEPFKDLAALQEQAGKDREAVAQYEKYLQLDPQARDKRYISSKIAKLNGRMQEEAAKNQPKGDPKRP